MVFITPYVFRVHFEHLAVRNTVRARPTTSFVSSVISTEPSRFVGPLANTYGSLATMSGAGFRYTDAIYVRKSALPAAFRWSKHAETYVRTRENATIIGVRRTTALTVFNSVIGTSAAATVTEQINKTR